jgi:hypothetical protein
MMHLGDVDNALDEHDKASTASATAKREFEAIDRRIKGERKGHNVEINRLETILQQHEVRRIASIAVSPLTPFFDRLTLRRPS